MAKIFDTKPNNFGTDASKSITKYLDHAGLISFWGRVKDYVDAQDVKLATTVNTKINANDAAVRAYIETLTVNGVDVVPSAPVAGGKNDSLAVTINGSHIVVGPNGGDTYKDGKVDEAIAELDSRAADLESVVKEGVVNSLTITEDHSDSPKYSYSPGEGQDKVTVDAWVDVTVDGNKKTGDITVNFDDTAITDRFNRMDEEIAELIANAGVTNIAVADVDSTGDRKNLVEISLQSSKASQSVTEGFEGDAGNSGRGDILISLDETALDEALEGIDTAVANEAASRKADVELLAGGDYVAGAKGAVGSWTDAPKYATIAGLSERVAELDANLVTEIVEGESKDTWVSLTVETQQIDASDPNKKDSKVVISLDDTVVSEKFGELDTAFQQLDGATINGKALYEVTYTAADGDDKASVAITAKNPILYSEDIMRGSSGETTSVSIEDSLADHDSKIAALSTAVNFRGVVTLGEGQTYEDGKTAALAKIVENGDFVIIGDKEYIYYDESQEGMFADGYTKNIQYFVELGDTTVENQRLGALEAWVDNNWITEAEIKELNDVISAEDDTWKGPDFVLE